MKKKLVLLLCVISCLMLATGCSLTRVNENLEESKLKKTTEQKVEDWFAMDYQSIIDQIEAEGGIEIYKEQYTQEAYENLETTFTQYKGFAEAQKEYGAFKKIEKTDYSLASTSASVSVRVSTENGNKIVFTSTYDKYGYETDFKVEEYQTIGQIMGRAGLNTVMAMAIVFIVLIFIALLISCFKFIAVIQDKMSGKAEEAAPVEAVVAVPAEENLADDLELVAVITAAIAAASENESADGLVVRSIVRRS